MKKTIWIARNSDGTWLRFEEYPQYVDGIWLVPTNSGGFCGDEIKDFALLQYYLPTAGHFDVPTVALFRIEFEEFKCSQTCECCNGKFDVDAKFYFDQNQTICQKCYDQRHTWNGFDSMPPADRKLVEAIDSSTLKEIRDLLVAIKSQLNGISKNEK